MLSSAWRKVISSFPPWFPNQTAKLSETEPHLPGHSRDDSEDLLMKLPTELLECIFEYVPVIDALIACHVSPLWNERLSSLRYYWRRWAEPYMDPRTLDKDPDWKSLCELVVSCLSKISKPSRDYYNKHEMIDFDPFPLGVSVLVTDYHDGYLLCVGDLPERTNVPQPHANVYKRVGRDWTLVCFFDMYTDEKMAQSCAMTKSKIVCWTDDGMVSFWSFDRSTNQATKICERNDEGGGVVKVIVASDELDSALLLGENKLTLWDLKTGSLLRSFPIVHRSHIKTVDILTGDRCPFVGYNCVFVEQHSQEQTTMYVWGHDIPLENALHVKISRDFDRYNDDPQMLHWYEHGDTFFQEGSQMYFLTCYSFDQHVVACPMWTKIVREKLNQEDMVIVERSNISDDTIEILRLPLHPCTRESSATLNEQFSRNSYQIGRLFSLFVDEDGQKCVAFNDTGDWTTISPHSAFGEQLQQGCDIQWLHGLNNIKPGTALGVVGGIKRQTVSMSWRLDVLKPQTLCGLLDARNHQDKGLLASLRRLRK